MLDIRSGLLHSIRTEKTTFNSFTSITRMSDRFNVDESVSICILLLLYRLVERNSMCLPDDNGFQRVAEISQTIKTMKPNDGLIFLMFCDVLWNASFIHYYLLEGLKI